MQQASGSRRLSYARTRQLILAAGLAILLVIAVVTYSRGVDPKEVTATVLFIPIFVGFVVGRLPGGVLTGLAAALVYAGIRYGDIQAFGPERFVGLIASRAIAFVLFGAIGGWASRQLEASVYKLELYDQIDDATGLFNARFFVQDTDLEMTRSVRYRTIFSVAVVDIPGSLLDQLSRRQRNGMLRELGRIMKDSVRQVDRAVHAFDGRRHRLAVVLPETAGEGTRVFTERFAERVEEYLTRRGVTVGREGLGSVAVTFPDDEEPMRNLRAEFAAIDRAEHPEGESGAASS